MKFNYFSSDDSAPACHNLMPGENGSLIPAQSPARIEMPAGYTPVAVIQGVVVASSTTSLAVISRGLPLNVLDPGPGLCGVEHFG